MEISGNAETIMQEAFRLHEMYITELEKRNMGDEFAKPGICLLALVETVGKLQDEVNQSG